ncbi:MAG: GNAT family N-acetyltransferase [Candidatus Thorarchaeota archaeon]|jgi:ribosomal protein S18 acetylase RimI-like enzyme
MTLSDEYNNEDIAIEIRDYNDEMASDVAAMWNTWDELWPGGFTQGIPYTAERVQKQYGKSDAISILIAIDNETKKPLGSCTLFAHWRDTEAAYIGTLGVSPEALGKKVGKRLLLESIKRASSKGYTRVDLNTWAGNMKAVPLYKKIGMMWNPEISGVHMEDYIPGILNHPLSRSFFEPLAGEHDWYDVHIRDPSQAPDEHELNGLAIFPYEFENDGNKLSVTIDRYGRGISAIDRTVSKSRLKFFARVDSHQVLCGLPYTYTLEVVNETEKDLEFSSSLEAFDGLIFDEQSTLTKTIASGEKFNWSVPFHLESTAPLFRDNIKAPIIVTSIQIEGERAELVTGLKVRAAAEIKTRWGVSRIVAGGKTEIPLTIVSNLPTKAISQIHLKTDDSSITASSEHKEIKLAADGFGGTVLQVSAESDLEEGAHDIWVSLEIETGESTTVKTRNFRVPVYCLGKRGVVVGRDDRQRRLVVASPIYTASFSEEGAILRVSNEYTSVGTGMQVRSSIGPPFGINPFRFAERDSSVNALETETVVSMKAKHPDRPLEIEDRARFEHGSGIILHEVWVKNISTESETFQLRLTGRGGDITFVEGSMIVPLSSGVMKSKLGNFYSTYPAIPSDPSGFAEGWIANEQEGLVTGQFWDHSAVEEVRVGLGQIGMISYPQLTLEPGETQCLSKLWFVFGTHTWEQVRRIWRARVGGYYQNQVDGIKSEVPKTLLNLESAPIVIPSIQEAKGKIHLSKSTLVPLPGTLRITSPEGWDVALETDDTEINIVKEGSGTSTEVQLMQDSAFDLNLNPDSKLPDTFAIHRGLIEFDTIWSVKKPIHLIQLGSAKGIVKVLEDVDQGLKVFRVSNGLIDFTVSPDFGGCLISLRNKQNVEFMTSSFPTPAPKPGGFFDNYYGGVQPIIFDDEMGEDFTKARTSREKMSGKPVEIGFWKGVEVKWVGKLQKLARGVSFKIRYLTTSNSPLVLIQWVITNKTSSPIKFWPSILIDPDLSNHFAGGNYQTDWDGEVVDLRKGMVPLAVTPSENIFWLKPNSKQSETTGFGFMIAGKESRMLTASLGEAMILASVDGMTWLMPGEEKIITASLIVDPESFEDLRTLQGMLDKF